MATVLTILAICPYNQILKPVSCMTTWEVIKGIALHVAKYVVFFSFIFLLVYFENTLIQTFFFNFETVLPIIPSSPILSF